MHIMFDEDGRKIKIREFPAKLEAYSVSEIDVYLDELEQEIERCRAERSKKELSQAAADSVFKS